MRNRSLLWAALFLLGVLVAPSNPVRGEDEDGTPVAGQVVSKDGTGVGGVEVRVRRGHRVLAYAQADDAGRFHVRVEGKEPVDVHVADRIASPTLTVWEGEALGVAVGTKDVRLVARSTPADRYLRVQVTCPTGPVEGIEVRLRPRPIGGKGYKDTTSTGFVRFGGLTSGEVAVEVDHLRPWVPARVERVTPEGQLLAILLEREKTIEGQVVDSSGRPVVGVGVLPDSRGDSTAQPVGDITGVGGEFRVAVPGSWTEARIRAGVTAPTVASSQDGTAALEWKAGEAPQPVRIVLPDRHAPSVEPSARDRDIASIYRLILKQAYLKPETKHFVVLDPLDLTIGPLMGWEVHACSSFGPGLGVLRDRVHASAWAAFMQPEPDVQHAPRHLGVGVPTHTVSRSWWYFLHRDRGDEFWKFFYEKFPNSTGVIDFMPIGFSDDGKEAMVHVSRFFGYLAATGTAYILKKTDRGWEITDQIGTWVS